MSQDNLQYGAWFKYADIISTEYGVWISGSTSPYRGATGR